MKAKTNKQLFSLMMVFILFFNIIWSFIPDVANGFDVDNGIQQQIASRFGVTSAFIEDELQKGRSINQIYTALFHAEQSSINYSEAFAELFPTEINQSGSVTTEVYNMLTPELDELELIGSKVTEDVYTNEFIVQPDGPVVNDVYSLLESKMSMLAANPNLPSLPSITEDAPVYDKTSFNEAPFSIQSEKETISTLSGNLNIHNMDMSLPGRNGLGFSLVRQYNSNDSQFYGMGATLVDEGEIKQRYYLNYTAVEKPVIKTYKVSYKEKKWIQEDNNGDGIVDVNSYSLPSTIKVIGDYGSYEGATQAASQKVTYNIPAESKTETGLKTSTNTNNFPEDISFSKDGFSGSLTKDGAPYVVSGTAGGTESQFKMHSCQIAISGKYDSIGFFSQYGYVYDNGCGNNTFNFDENGFKGKLEKFSTLYSQGPCPSYDWSRKNQSCSESGLAQYTGTVYKTISESRLWGQKYKGVVNKPGYTSDISYGPWVDNGQGGKTRYAYTMDGLPWIDTIETEGSGSDVTMITPLFNTKMEAESEAERLNSRPGQKINVSDNETGGIQYRYYVANPANPVIIGVDSYYQPRYVYYNETHTPKEELLYPLGKGWSWQLPYIDIKDDKKYLHLVSGGSYEIEEDKLKNYEWKGLSLVADESVRVRDELSAYVLKAEGSLQKQYFSSDGRLLQISDAYNNFIRFEYEHNNVYNRKLLSKIEDSIGNSIQIAYTAEKVTLTKGSESVVYTKHKENGIELLDTVIDQAGRKSTYSYTLAPAKFNLKASQPKRQLFNPYALLTKVMHPTGAATVYEYDKEPITRYIGSNAVNQAYRAVSRVDQVFYVKDQVEEFNRETIQYNSDLAAVYAGDATFSTNINNGLTNATYKYNKKYINFGMGSQYYLEQFIVRAGQNESTTSYQYNKQIEGREYAASVPTETTSSNNQNSDVFTTSSRYDDYGNVMESTDERGSTSYYTYDDKHLVRTAIEPLNANTNAYTANVRNQQGDIIETTVRENNENGKLLSRVQYSSRDEYGNVTTQTIYNGDKAITTTSEFSDQYNNAFPAVQQVQVGNADGDQSTITKSFTYDKSTGLMKSATDGNGHETKYQYDALGRVTEVTFPDQKQMSVLYNDQANSVEITNELGIRAKNQFNALGWTIETGLFKGNAYQVTGKSDYDRHGRMVTSEDVGGNLTRYAYDALSRLTTTTYPDSSTSNVLYNDAQRQVTHLDEEGNQQISTYDKWKRLVAVEENGGHIDKRTIVAKYEYDRISDQVLNQVDALNQSTSYSYNSLGNLTSVKAANNELTSYDYDMLGNLVQMTYPDGNKKSRSYDELGRVIQSQDEKGNAHKQYFDANGNVIRTADRNGNETVLEYDSRNRLISRTSKGENVSYTYDAAGKRLTMTDQSGMTSYEYDPYTEQLKSMTYPDGLKLTNQYDLNQNRVQMTGPFGAETFYTYDNRNRMKTIGTKEDQPELTYSYYRNGLNQGVVSNNGVESQYTFDRLQLTDLVQSAVGQEIQRYHYAYDKNKNISQRIQNGIEDSFEYDELNRIRTSSEYNEAYSYDARGNRLTQTTEKELKLAPKELSYDAQNRLSKVVVGGETVTYQYSGDGFLVGKLEKGVQTRYYYDSNQEQIIAEATIENGTPKLVANYIRGNKLEVIKYADDTKAYPVYNGHGDVTELRDETGALLNSYEYDLWGNPTSKQETVHNPFLYAGEIWDDTVELQYLRARWYDPSMGRFINQDAYEGELDNPLSLNLYTYVENNPLIYTDPTGHKVWLIHGTFSDETTWTPNFVKYVEDLFDESSEKLNWSGKNRKGPRSDAAEVMLNKVNEWQKKHPDDPIRLVGHSHGGNVAILLTNLLAEKGLEVQTLITIATPVREYKLNTKVGQHIQMYNNRDSVQMDMGGMWLIFSPTTRKFKGAENIRAKDAEMSGTKIQVHSAMHSNINIWKKYIEPILKTGKHSYSSGKGSF